MNVIKNFNWRQLKNESWVTLLFLAIQVAVFLIMTVVGVLRGYGLSGTTNANLLFEFGAMSPHAVILNHEYWRFITPIFIHIGLAHLLFNSVFLYFAGRDLEALMGHRNFFFFYLLSGIAGNLFSFAFADSLTISAGASTALFGIFGGFIALGRIFRHHPTVRYMAQNMLRLAVINIIFNLFSPSIDILGHIGGLIGGLLLGFAFSAANLKNSRYDVTEDNIHRRIACSLGFALGMVALVLVAVQRYGLFF